MDIRIRNVEPDDVEGIYRVYHETWLTTYPNEEHGITIDDILDHLPKELSPEERESRRAYYADIPAHKVVYVALDGNGVVGVCAGAMHEDYTHLRSLYVLTEYQGKGIGSMLFEHFKKWAGDTPRFVVHVATYNNSAIRFYEKLGFKDTGKRFSEERFIFKSGASIPEMEMEMQNTQ
jgi:ribosomal protein S18 acetylase RimI-like enzyme